MRRERAGTESEPTGRRPPEHPAVPAAVSNAALARRLARQLDEAPVTAPGMTGAQQWHERGVAHYKAGRFDRALAAFAEAYKLNPLSTFLHDQADALERLGRRAEAADMYERYLAAGPLSADVPKVTTRIRKLRGEAVPEAEDDDAAEIVASGEAGARQWFDRAQAAFVAGRHAQAAEGFRRAFALLPRAAFIYDEAVALERGRHAAAAANAYEHFLVLDPGSTDAAEVAAKVRTLRGQAPPPGPDGLLDPEDEAAEAPAARTASDWYDRGAAAFLTGDYQRAYEYFQRAYDLAPHAAFVFNQAACLDRAGNADAAVQAYERYLALDPRARDAGRVRERIRRLREGEALKRP
jgi:tetratricopeptide (TPR) repeat protein